MLQKLILCILALIAIVALIIAIIALTKKGPKIPTLYIPASCYSCKTDSRDSITGVCKGLAYTKPFGCEPYASTLDAFTHYKSTCGGVMRIGNLVFTNKKGTLVLTGSGYGSENFTPTSHSEDIMDFWRLTVKGTQGYSNVDTYAVMHIEKIGKETFFVIKF